MNQPFPFGAVVAATFCACSANQILSSWFPYLVREECSAEHARLGFSIPLVDVPWTPTVASGALAVVALLAHNLAAARPVSVRALLLVALLTTAAFQAVYVPAFTVPLFVVFQNFDGSLPAPTQWLIDGWVPIALGALIVVAVMLSVRWRNAALAVAACAALCGVALTAMAIALPQLLFCGNAQ